MNDIGIDFRSAIDWLSIKLNGVTIFVVAITGNKLMLILGAVATGTTIIYNLIRIYKEVKNKKKNGI